MDYKSGSCAKPSRRAHRHLWQPALASPCRWVFLTTTNTSLFPNTSVQVQLFLSFSTNSFAHPEFLHVHRVTDVIVYTASLTEQNMQCDGLSGWADTSLSLVSARRTGLHSASLPRGHWTVVHALYVEKLIISWSISDEVELCTGQNQSTNAACGHRM